MTDFPTRILHELARKGYQPLKPKALARKLGVTDDAYPDFRRAVKALLKDGRVELGKNNVLRPADQFGSVIGVYRRANSGHGYVRPDPIDGKPQPDVFVREGNERDASTGDKVMLRLTRRPGRMRDAAGEVIRVLERATRTFVGTYFERDGQAYVRVDGTVFAHSVAVGDPGAKGARPQDKVVLDMLRFPTADDRGEGVITEVLGPLSQPGVDLLGIIKAFGLPEAFPEEALAEARAAADKFREDDLAGRTDFTGDCVITIDPADARDFDDAVSVTIDPKTKHWVLTVHIADVGAFAPPGGALDAEARKRATSVYLPQKVIPMFPEVISNGLASLQEGKLRYVKTVRMEFTAGLQKGHVQFFNGAIRAKKRFTYSQVQDIFDALDRGMGDGGSGMAAGPARGQPTADAHPHAEAIPDPPSPIPDDVLQSLRRARDLAKLLRKKRFKRGALELSMPEPVLEYDADGRVSGAHFAAHDESHQLIETFMLAANEAVAEHLSVEQVPFLRRNHPAPNEEKLEQFAQFASLLGYPIRRPEDRFELQRLLNVTADKPERAAIHYALLRSLKQATYSPDRDEHYALASPDYCHFTSPIRRYPDLQVHRQLDRWLKRKSTGTPEAELRALGDHCSKMERRAETAERELVKLKLIQHLATRIGEELDAVVTGVAEYGFFAQAERFPAEGLVHISSLTDDYYAYDDESHSLVGGRSKRRIRLGDRVRVAVARVDVQRRMLDFRLAGMTPSGSRQESGFRSQGKKGRKRRP